jgi:hypothetical protein
MVKTKDKPGKYRIQRAVALFERLSKQSEAEGTALKLKLVKMKGNSGKSSSNKANKRESRKPEATGSGDEQPHTEAGANKEPTSVAPTAAPATAAMAPVAPSTSTPMKRKPERAEAPNSKRQEAGESENDDDNDAVMETDQPTSTKNESYRFIHETINEICAAGLLPPEFTAKLKGVLTHVDLLLKETIKKASKDAIMQMQKEHELGAVARSVMVYNLNKIAVDKQLYDRAPLEEVLTEELLRFTRHRINVQDVVTFGRDDKGVPTMARVLLGSSRQRAILYRLLGEMGSGTKMEAMETMRPLSFRDMFPKELMEDSKARVQQGLALKRAGAVHSFRVVAQGTGCVPVLQVRNRQKERWVVWNGAMDDRATNVLLP